MHFPLHRDHVLLLAAGEGGFSPSELSPDHDTMFMEGTPWSRQKETTHMYFLKMLLPDVKSGTF